MNKFSHAVATGGIVATIDALKLWGGLAIGGANYSMLDARRRSELEAAHAGFNSAVQDLTEEGNIVLVLEWAHRLLSICYKIESTNASNATVRTSDGSRLLWNDALRDGVSVDFTQLQPPDWVKFQWSGTFTSGLYINISLRMGDVDEKKVSLEWDTGTGQPSEYLGLPSLTDEAESLEGRREGGWVSREALPDKEKENS